MSNRQPSIPPFGRTVICLPLVKFSFATVTFHMTSVPWSHVHSEELFVLLEHVGPNQDHDLQLKVVQGSNTLEQIPLSTLVRAAVKIKEAHEETSGHFTKIEHLPIFAMTKENAIAIRYNLPSNESRRTQMNFNNDTHRTELLAMLQDMGMVITGAKQKPLPAVQSSAAQAPSYDRSSVTPSPVYQQPRSLSEPQYHSRPDARPCSRAETSSHDPHRDSRLIPAFGSSSRVPPGDHSSSQQRSSAFQVPEAQSVPSLGQSAEHSILVSSFDTPMRDANSEPPITLHDLLPPRRELPFNRSSRPSSSASDLPPLPKPSFVGQQSKVKEANSRPYDLEQSERPSSPYGAITQSPRIDVSSPPVYFERPSNRLSKPHSARSPLGHDDGVNHVDGRSSPNPQQSPSRNDNYSMSTGESSTDHNGGPISSNVPRSVSTHRPVFESSSPNSMYHPSSDHTATQGPYNTPQSSSHVSWTPVDTLVSNPHFQAHLHGDETQARAAEARPPLDPRMTREERDREFDNWLCGRLEDPQFLQLCIQMEAAWRFRVHGEHVGQAG